MNTFFLHRSKNSHPNKESFDIEQKKIFAYREYDEFFSFTHKKTYASSFKNLTKNNDKKKLINQIYKSENLIVFCDAVIENLDFILELLKIDKLLSNEEIFFLLYKKYDQDFIKYIKGSFNFLIADLKKDEYIFGSDRFCTKPLFFSVQNNNFFISTEIKSFKNLSIFNKSLNYKTLYNQLVVSFQKPGETYFKDISKVEKATVYVYKNGLLNSKKYYKLTYLEKTQLPYKQIIDKTRELFLKSVKANCYSNTKVISSITSGGLDSSSITAALSYIDSKEINSYSVNFSGISKEDFLKSDERKYINEIAKFKNVYHEFCIAHEDGPFSFQERFDHDLDQPLLNGNYFFTDYIYPKVRQNGGRILLEGIDGDTVLSYGFGHLIELGRRLEFVSAFKNYQKLCKGRKRKPTVYDFLKSIIIKPNLPRNVNQFLRKIFGKDTWEERNLKRLKKSYHPKNLQSLIDQTYGYKRGIFINSQQNHLNEINSNIWEYIFSFSYEIACSYGIEVRLPYFNQDLIELSLSLPSNLKFSDGVDRYIFREAMKGIVPLSILKKTSKADLSSLGRNDLRKHSKTLMNYFSSNSYKLYGVVDKIYIDKCLKFLTNDKNGHLYTSVLADLYAIEKWLSREGFDIDIEEFSKCSKI